MENDPKEEIHEKSLLAEARRNLEDIARAEAEEAAEAERERSKISDVEETSGSGGNSADLNKMQAAETGAGASVLPLPLSPGQNVQKTTMSSDDSTLSERSGRSVSDASNKVLEPSTFSMKSRESHKDHTNITSNASQDVGHVVAEKSEEDTPGAPNEVEAATNDIAETENHGFSHGGHTVNKLTVPSSAESPNVKQETNALTIPPPPNPYMEVGRVTGRTLTSSTIADLMSDERSQDGAVSAVLEVLGNSEPMTPTLSETANPILPTKKKSFIRRLFKKKSRTSNRANTQTEEDQ